MARACLLLLALNTLPHGASGDKEVEAQGPIAELKVPAECQFSKYPGVAEFIEKGHANAFADANKGLKFKQGIGLMKPVLNIW